MPGGSALRFRSLPKRLGNMAGVRAFACLVALAILGLQGGDAFQGARLFGGGTGLRAAAPAAPRPGPRPRGATALGVSRLQSMNNWLAVKGDWLKERTNALVLTGREASSPLFKISCYTQAVLAYSLFVLYRSYRGCLIILPTVFLEVQRKLREGIAVADSNVKDDVDPASGKMKLRSAMVIWVGAVFYTAAIVLKTFADGMGYVVRGIVGAVTGGGKRGAADSGAAPAADADSGTAPAAPAASAEG